jgi:MFS family permease
MSQFDAAPPNTHAGGNDDALRTKGHDPMNAPTAHEVADERVNMEEYERAVPLWKRVWQNSLTQMVLLSIQAFCGPAMADAIAGRDLKALRTCERYSLLLLGLGGGGLATPQTSNIATAVNYTMLAVCCALGGPIVNKLGTKWSLVIGAASFPIRGSSYYCNSKFGNQWYLILGGFFTGIGTGTWYVAESGTIMSLAPSQSRGKYLALWIVARNLGQLVGGAIK